METGKDGFVEGAWNGEFDSMAFDEATALVGSGGRLRGDDIVFSSPFHPLEHLYVLATKDSVLVSNSLAFILVEVEDRPDIHHPGYFFDLLKHARAGVPNLLVELPTSAGHRIRPFHVCNLRVEGDLNCHELPKPSTVPPRCYHDWHGNLLETVTRVARNAIDPARTRTYRLVSAISKGYDSTATAALAAQAGGTEAATFVKSSVDGNLADDCGTEIASYLGMTATEYDRVDVRHLPSFPEAEFFSNPGNFSEIGLCLMESQLAGSLFTTGRHGEDFLGTAGNFSCRDLREPGNTGMPGRGSTDFRVRVGYFNFPILYLGASHAPDLHQITHSHEMRPWMLGTGSYDRPIARRMVEEAGVPRTAFGQRKLGGEGRELRALNEKSEADFRAFCEAEVPPAVLRKLDGRRQVEKDRLHFRMAYIRQQCAGWSFTRPLLDLIPLDRWHAMWNSIYLYRFHWGFDRIRSRYRV